ncbi:MAG: protein kinase [Planctomycetia bacterium]|nr:protein kinase [Planctomycetia bacterium]
MPAMPHPTAAELKALVLGQTEEASLLSLEEHLNGCSECQRLAADIPGDTLVELLRSAQTIVIADASTPPAIRNDETLVVGPVIDSPEALPAALVNHDRYRLLRPLGAGGMGAVWLAEHRVMNRQVALKIIRPEFLEKPGAIERFRREVQAAARLHHPNIVTAHDAEEAGGLHFLVMEYVSGSDLQAVLEERGPLLVADACEYIRQAALGLEHAHEHGMVHRDIKPQNLMRRDEGREKLGEGAGPSGEKDKASASSLTLWSAPLVKILDFGLASLLASASGDEPVPVSAESQKSSLTQVGALMGTPDYMAPEQARDARTADIRSDIYSLGGTLYFVLTGKVPFPGGTAIDKIIAHAQRKPQPISEVRADVPPALVKIIDKMTAKEPAQRYQTPAEVAAALQPFAAGTIAKPRRGIRRIVAAAVLAAAVLLCGAIIYVQTDKGEFIINTSDEDVAVIVNSSGVKIRDQVSGREYLLKAGTQDVRTGNYKIVLSELPEGIEIEGDVFTVKRSGRAVATAKLREKSDKERMQGEWDLVNPPNLPPFPGFTFTGNRMRISNFLGGDDEGRFDLDESAQPKQFTYISSTSRLAYYAIYRFNGDALELHMTEFEKDRPTEFIDKGFSKTHGLFVLKRPSGPNPPSASEKPQSKRADK